MKGSKKRTYDNFKNGASAKPQKRRKLKRNDDSDS